MPQNRQQQQQRSAPAQASVLPGKPAIPPRSDVPPAGNHPYGGQPQQSQQPQMPSSHQTGPMVPAARRPSTVESAQDRQSPFARVQAPPQPHHAASTHEPQPSSQPPMTTATSVSSGGGLASRAGSQHRLPSTAWPAAGAARAPSQTPAFSAAQHSEEASCPAAHAQQAPAQAAQQQQGQWPKEGRPACALVAFGFGGQVLLMRPRRQTAQPSAGSKPGHNHSAWQPAGDIDMAKVGRVCMQGGLHDESPQLLASFPGPLLPATPPAKVAGFLTEQQEHLQQQQRPGASRGAERELTGVLRVLAQHSGSLHTPPTAGKGATAAAARDPATLPEAALAAVMAPEASSSSTLTAGPQSPDAARQGQAAGEMQHLLLSNQRAEALRVAQAAGLWGPALLLARSLGDAAFQETAAAMAGATLAPGQPLQTLCLLLAGLPAASILTPASGAELSSSEPSMGTGAAEALLSSWREHVAVLGSSGTPGADALLTQLGDRLWQQLGEVTAAHVCYVAAGVPPQAFDPSSRMCLPGVDHRRNPRSFCTSAAAMQRSEVLEWARTQGNAAFAQQALAWLPYRLVYAQHLAEHGHVNAASGYAAKLVASLASIQRPPPGLLVARAMSADLSQRLQAHAAAFHIQITAGPGGSVLGSMGRWLDRGINKLIGVGSGPPSNASSDAGAELAAARAASGAVPALLGLQSGPPSPAARGPHQRSASAADVPSAAYQSASTPDLMHQVHHAHSATMGAPAVAKAAQQSGPASTGRITNFLGKVGGIGSFLGGGTAAPKSNPTEESSRDGGGAAAAEDNVFYYDEQLKQWRERGAPPPPAPAEVAPPPVSSRPPEAAASAASNSRVPGDVRSRYVDTLSTSR
ncbi:hypothetical protein WJX73_003988 [Symbiochloris irregularis]|uniref:Protein transport protein sec16 n=1 Tax=Symbiochloris irregularis TaxID=706552 RepID=A0AAW1PD31_9CHLO